MSTDKPSWDAFPADDTLIESLKPGDKVWIKTGMPPIHGRRMIVFDGADMRYIYGRDGTSPYKASYFRWRVLGRCVTRLYTDFVG